LGALARPDCAWRAETGDLVAIAIAIVIVGAGAVADTMPAALHDRGTTIPSWSETDRLLTIAPDSAVFACVWARLLARNRTDFS
jgi:hypothetical protein